YGMSAEEAPGSNDEILEYYGLKVLVDKDDAPVLNGTKNDFKLSLMGGGFHIDNPNGIASCGCFSAFRAVEVAGHREKC
ncbi:HesB/IscA family protein, partial [Staphylococcus hominis]|uniref:HesB/IscA family protein n=1 Tax=Staphylococcus hominis TaxID=1290 RepID=UPI000851E180